MGKVEVARVNGYGLPDEESAEWVDLFRVEDGAELVEAVNDALGTDGEAYDIPEYLEYYIDWERMSEDMISSDYYEVPASGGGVHVFSNF